MTVKLGTETVLEKNVTTTEIDLSSLTVEGTYKVTVEAVPENTAEKLASRATADYTASTPGPDTSESDSSKSDTSDPADTDGSGCGSVAGIGAISLLLAGMGAALVLKKSKKD